MCKVKVVTFGSLFLLLCIALFAWNIVEAQEAPQPIPAPLQQPPQSTMPQVVPPPLIDGTPRTDGGIAPRTLPRLNIVIDPKTPLANLLPLAPQSALKPTTRFLDDLRNVPEVTFQQPLSSKLTSEKATFEIAHQLTKIRHVNQQKSDAFLEALIDHRADLKGIPFAMGEACRTMGLRAKYLAFFSGATRACVVEATEANPSPHINPDKFWTAMSKNLQAPEEAIAKTQCAQDRDDFEAARVAAVMQILAPESPAVRLGLIKYLSRTPHVDATRALAKIVLFSAEDEVRVAATQALKLRRERDFAPILVQGFRYPLPEVAKRAGEALVRLECTDAVPQLVDLLDEPDPRLPVTKEVEGKKIALVQEVVRVNHHRNCVLCHAPSDNEEANGGAPTQISFSVMAEKTVVKEVEGTMPDGVTTVKRTIETAVRVPEQRQFAAFLTSQVPLPNEPLPSLSTGGYGNVGSPDIMVRIDVTYLRQDFSLMMPVHDAAPWPDQQRFDFLVRSRVLSTKEAAEYQQLAPKTAAGFTTPYQRAVLFALRELTQRDAAPTPQAWRDMLGLPTKGGK